MLSMYGCQNPSNNFFLLLTYIHITYLLCALICSLHFLVDKWCLTQILRLYFATMMFRKVKFSIHYCNSWNRISCFALCFRFIVTATELSLIWAVTSLIHWIIELNIIRANFHSQIRVLEVGILSVVNKKITCVSWNFIAVLSK